MPIYFLKIGVIVFPGIIGGECVYISGFVKEFQGMYTNSQCTFKIDIGVMFEAFVEFGKAHSISCIGVNGLVVRGGKCDISELYIFPIGEVGDGFTTEFLNFGPFFIWDECGD
tara:strand:+ start:1478 stop:1816 length:339 start_codon:yes stop_codon:yes gene_type:complete